MLGAHRQSLASRSRIRAEAFAFFFVSDLPFVFPVRLSTMAYFEPRFCTPWGMVSFLRGLPRRIPAAGDSQAPDRAAVSRGYAGCAAVALSGGASSTSCRSSTSAEASSRRESHRNGTASAEIPADIR